MPVFLNNIFRNGWAAQAALIVLGVTLLRLGVLALTKADIFVDEAQYWLWGQTLDFGYYSKPPLIAWVIRATTDLAGSDSAFWIRFPAPIFHGLTALILGAWAARAFDSRTALWTAIGYVTLPITAVGSIMISTDTIMAPFLAAGLLFYWRMLATARLSDALIAGAMIGAAVMAKYAGVYFFIGAGLAAIFVPTCRPTLRNTLALLAAFAVVIAPNIWWNLAHDLTTVEHTMDNVSWVRGSGEGALLHPLALLEFLATQFAVAGPILFAALLLASRSPDPKLRALVLFALPIIALVSLQALLSRAYGNWAFAAYLPGTVAATAWLASRSPRWLWASLAINAALALAVPALTIFGTGLSFQGRPILARYMGRQDLSRQILILADETRPAAIVASDRDVLADLFLTGQRSPIPIRALPPTGRAMNYYEQTYPLEPSIQGRILFITNRKRLLCGAEEVRPLAPFHTEGGAYADKGLRAYLLRPDCYEAMR
ncbi:MAG: glycosyltransferase family 39 protein [Paracoccaceae bacterium]